MAAAPALTNKRIKLYSPHAGQQKMHQSTARFRAATCGRRFGKTMMAANEVVRFGLGKADAICWWVAPVYQQTEKGYRMVKDVLVKAGIKFKELKTLSRIILPNGTLIEFKSATNFDNLRGEGVDLLVIDEAPYVPEDAWNKALRATLSDKKGKAIFIGTPKGKNWFYRIWVRGQDRVKYPAYESWQMASADNPYIEPSEIQEAKDSLPSDVFQQEYEAIFLEESAGVFRNIRACMVGHFEGPIPGHSYVIGWDPAKHEDFSVMFVMERRSKRVVAYDRFNQIDYGLQLARLETLAKQYHARVLMDSTGIGDPLIEQVRKLGISVEGYMLGNKSKQQLIESLAIAIERRAITFPEIPVLLNELADFRYEITKSRNIVYSAPEGMHDDTVIALGLAYWACKGSRMFGVLGDQKRVADGQMIVVPPQKAPEDPNAAQKGWYIDPQTKMPMYPDQRLTGTSMQTYNLPGNGRQVYNPNASDNAFPGVRELPMGAMASVSDLVVQYQGAP